MSKLDFFYNAGLALLFENTEYIDKNTFFYYNTCKNDSASYLLCGDLVLCSAFVDTFNIYHSLTNACTLIGKRMTIMTDADISCLSKMKRSTITSDLPYVKDTFTMDEMKLYINFPSLYDDYISNIKLVTPTNEYLSIEQMEFMYNLYNKLNQPILSNGNFNLIEFNYENMNKIYFKYIKYNKHNENT